MAGMTGNTPRNLGPARKGGAEWLAQRIFGAAMVPLVIWLLASLLIARPDAFQDYVLWASAGVNALPLILLLAVMFHHAHHGLKDIVRDYVHQPFCKLLLAALVKLGCFGLAAVGILAVMRLAIWGS